MKSRLEGYNSFKEIKYTKYMVIFLIAMIVFIGSSFAYYSWGSEDNTNIAFDVIADSVYIYYDAGEDIVGSKLYPTDDKNDGITKEITVRVDKENATARFNLYLDLKTLPEGLKHESFRYQLYGVNADGSLFNIGSNGVLTNSSNTVGGNFSSDGVFCTVNNVMHYVLLSDVNPTVEEMKYKLYIWIDGVNYTNPSDMMDQSFEFILHADGVKVKEPESSASGATYLDTLYNSATTTAVTTAGGESITQATTLGLMQDSFGNIRYYGADPDNYVTFNGEEAGWRIIGAFDVEDENGNTERRLKLIRATSIGSYAYDNKLSGVGSSTTNNGSNNWKDARLMMLLNPGYETESNLYAYEGSLYWNRKIGTCYSGENSGTTTCSFTSTGLTTEAKNMIGQTKYYLGGSSSYQGLYADDYYIFERNTTENTEWTGYVGIMYPSDYVYATDLSVCTKDGYNYHNDTNCKEKDWLLDPGNTTWTIAPSLAVTYGEFFVSSTGYVDDYNYVYNAGEVRPVLYLRSNITIVGGTGDVDDSFILG